MCAVCGCGTTDTKAHTHVLEDGTVVQHTHAHTGGLGPHGEHHEPAGAAAAELPSRLVRLELDLLESNDLRAKANRALFRANGTLTLNLMSSPGAGKTTLLVRTLGALREAHAVGVIEGDQETSLDADRIRATGAPAVQVNTGKACHLDAAMVARALTQLPELTSGLLFIENVGNLVCPAAFDLGEGKRVVIVSVTEGEDKPLKYPQMFARADLLLVTKSDLLPHVGIDLPLLLRRAAEVNPHVESLVVSARTGEGMDAWYAWLARVRTEPLP
jgi:hydrogenase nickel incorporation protein HypB